jgi:hypothetical protein
MEEIALLPFAPAALQLARFCRPTTVASPEISPPEPRVVFGGFALADVEVVGRRLGALRKLQPLGQEWLQRTHR